MWSQAECNAAYVLADQIPWLIAKNVDMSQYPQFQEDQAAAVAALWTWYSTFREFVNSNCKKPPAP